MERESSCTSTKAVNIVSVRLIQVTRKFRVPTRYKIEGHVRSAYKVEVYSETSGVDTSRRRRRRSISHPRAHRRGDGETQTSSYWLTVKFVKNSRNKVGAKFCDAAAADADRRQTTVD